MTKEDIVESLLGEVLLLQTRVTALEKESKKRSKREFEAGLNEGNNSGQD